jgi:2-iminobutanoate/2-iminopropanoate deaminase
MPKERFFSPDLPEPVSHYADAVRAGNLLFISGLVSVDKDGNPLGVGDAVEQTRVILEHMQTLLAMNGAGFDDVVKVIVYVRNIEDRARINTVRQQYFGAARPSSTLVEVTKLVRPEYLLEIEAIAVLDA